MPVFWSCVSCTVSTFLISNLFCDWFNRNFFNFFMVFGYFYFLLEMFHFLFYWFFQSMTWSWKFLICDVYFLFYLFLIHLIFFLSLMTSCIHSYLALSFMHINFISLDYGCWSNKAHVSGFSNGNYIIFLGCFLVACWSQLPLFSSLLWIFLLHMLWHTLITWLLVSEWTPWYATPQCVGMLLTFCIFQFTWPIHVWR